MSQGQIPPEIARWYADVRVPDLTINTREELEAEAALLWHARAILQERFRTGKHEATADRVRSGAVELLSRARHPSRQPIT